MTFDLYLEKYELIIEIIVSGDETVKQKIQKFFLENKYRSLFIICLAGLSLIFLSRLIFTSEKAIKKEVLKPLVHTEVIYRRPMYKTISLFGKTVSDAQVDIINKYAGKIEEINVDLGSNVNKDDILIIQELHDVDAELLKAQARYREADATASKTDTEYNADYYKYKADYELAQINFERYKKLHEMGAVSKLEYDKIKQVMVNAQAAYESLADQKLYDGVPASLYAKEQVAQRRYQEFVLLRNGALCFIEAKSSCPRALRENLSEEDKAKKKEDYDRFVREISEKMKDSIELFGTILLKRHEQTGLSEEMYEAGLVGSQIKPIVVVNTKGAGWNPDPEVQDSIRGKLGPITKMWNMRPILIINEIKAREKHLIV